MSPWDKGPIILLEDNENDVFFTRESLAKARIGNPLIVFDSPAHAQLELEGHAAEPPVLFILDVNLQGGMSGLDFLRWIREQPEPFGSTPTIMLTGSDRPEDHDESVKLNALHYITKPATDEALVSAVQALGYVIVTNLPSGELGFRIIQRGIVRF